MRRSTWAHPIRRSGQLRPGHAVFGGTGPIDHDLRVPGAPDRVQGHVQQHATGVQPDGRRQRLRQSQRGGAVRGGDDAEGRRLRLGRLCQGHGGPQRQHGLCRHRRRIPEVRGHCHQHCLRAIASETIAAEWGSLFTSHRLYPPAAISSPGPAWCSEQSSPSPAWWSRGACARAVSSSGRSGRTSASRSGGSRARTTPTALTRPAPCPSPSFSHVRRPPRGGTFTRPAWSQPTRW